MKLLEDGHLHLCRNKVGIPVWVSSSYQEGSWCGLYPSHQWMILFSDLTERPDGPLHQNTPVYILGKVFHGGPGH